MLVTSTFSLTSSVACLWMLLIFETGILVVFWVFWNRGRYSTWTRELKWGSHDLTYFFSFLEQRYWVLHLYLLLRDSHFSEIMSNKQVVCDVRLSLYDTCSSWYVSHRRGSVIMDWLACEYQKHLISTTPFPMGGWCSMPNQSKIVLPNLQCRISIWSFHSVLSKGHFLSIWIG